MRSCLEDVYAIVLPDAPLLDLVVEVDLARNELGRHAGESPNVQVFGRELRNMLGFITNDGEDWSPFAVSFHDQDEECRFRSQARTAARMAYAKAATENIVDRLELYRTRAIRGPFENGERLLVYRRRIGSHSIMIIPKKGSWHGPGVVIAKESSGDRFRAREYHVVLHGRLHLCADAQLRALSPSRQIARERLGQFSADGRLLVGNTDLEVLSKDLVIKGVDVIGEVEGAEDAIMPPHEVNTKPEEVPAAEEILFFENLPLKRAICPAEDPNLHLDLSSISPQAGAPQPMADAPRWAKKLIPLAGPAGLRTQQKDAGNSPTQRMVAIPPASLAERSPPPDGRSQPEIRNRAGFSPQPSVLSPIAWSPPRVSRRFNASPADMVQTTTAPPGTTIPETPESARTGDNLTEA